MLETKSGFDEPWLRAKGRRAQREYPTVQEMLDDIWQAHEHGWLPLSMTEQRQRNARLKQPWTWLRKQVTYVVTYRHSAR